MANPDAPREPTPELAELTVTLGPDSLPAEVAVTDANANVNRFALSAWRSAGRPAAGAFSPALPGAAPCEPEQ